MPEFVTDDVHMKLVNKISNQAVQLGDLNKSLCRSAEYIETCQSRIRELENFTSLDSKRNDQQAQLNLEDAIRSQAESKKIISQLEEDLLSKCRQCSAVEKKLVELRTEMQKVKLQLRTSQHGLRFVSRPANAIDKGRQMQPHVASGSRIEIESLQTHISKYEFRLEEAKVIENTMALKISVLEEIIEEQSKYTGAKGHAELLTKVTRQRRLIRKLKSELERKTLEIAGATAALTGTPSPINHKSNELASSLNNSFSSCDSSISSHEEKISAMEQIITSLQKKFLSAEREVKRLKSDEMVAQLQMIEEERNTLLDYIQGDMMKSTDINNQLDKCKADLSHNMKALVEQKELGDKSERNYHAELARAATLAADLSASQKKILMIEGDHNSHNIERSEEAKKGAYIINVLTSELKISRGKIADMDRMQDDLQRANDDLRASLTKVREELSLSDQNVALGTVPKPDSIFSDSGTNTVIRAAVASSDANARATCDVSQQSKILEQEILLLRKEKEERQDGKLVLLKKGDASSLHNEALFELTKDLSALEVEKNDTNRVIELSQKNPLSLPPPPSSIGILLNQGEDNSSYSSTYSRTRNTCIPSYMGSTSSSSPPRHRTKTSVPQKSTQRGHCIEKIDTRSNKMLEVEEIQSCPMTLRHHKWVNLPSLRNVSTLLHENITNIANDLQCSELMCLEVERKLAKSQLVIEELKTEHKNEILKYMTATKIRDREMVEMKTNLEMTERNLKTGLDVHEILDKITVAFLSAPGGYGMFSDDFDGSELLDFKHENDSKAVSNQLSDIEFYGTQSTEDRISSSANHSYHGQSLSRDRDSPSPDPRKSLTMKRTNNNHMYGNPASCSPMIFDDIPNQRTNRWKVEDFASQPLRNSCVQSLDCSISPQSLPEMVIKSVAIATCAIKKLKIADEMLSKSLADLQSIQSALRISKGECEHLFNQLEDAKMNNSKITFIYSDMERSLRKDLESATDLVERQNSLIVSSDSKVQSLVRDKHLVSGQLTSTIQRESKSNEKILTVLLEYVRKAGINPRRLPVDSSEGMNAVTTYLEEILTILVHSHLLQSASVKCPLERIVAGSASEGAVTKKHGGGDQKELEKIQGYVEDRQEKKKIDPYQSSNLSGPDYANHCSLVEMDGSSEQRSSLSRGRPRFSPLICSTPDQKIYIHDLTSRNATSLTRIADSSINSAKSGGVQTGHLLYGNEDPRTISLQSSTDFIRNLKSRRRALDGS